MLFGSLPGASQKTWVVCVTVVKFWVLGSSLEGPQGAQKEHPEIADSSRDLLKTCMTKLI